LGRTYIANDSILNRVKILSVDTKAKESIVANIFFHCYDRRRWKKFHRLCTQQR